MFSFRLIFVQPIPRNLRRKTMVTVTRSWSTRAVCPIVAPFGDDQSWEQARAESERRIAATRGSFELTAVVIERAQQFLRTHFPDCREEIAAMTDEAIVDMYLDL